jgi:hypothetical protein
MAVVVATEKGEWVGHVLKFATANVAAQNDYISFSNEAGIIPINIMVLGNATSGATMFGTVNYLTLRANGANSAANTTATYNEAPVSVTRYSTGTYILVGETGEIMYSTTDSQSGETGTMTVIRGCLGTTAAAYSNDAYLFMMNSFKVDSLPAGVRWFTFIPYPRDFKARVWGA